MQSLDLRQGLQPLPGEALGEQRQELHHGRAVRELIERAGQKPLDGLGAEVTGELALQSSASLPEGELLVGAQGFPRASWERLSGHCRSPSMLAASRVIRPDRSS